MLADQARWSQAHGNTPGPIALASDKMRVHQTGVREILRDHAAE